MKNRFRFFCIIVMLIIFSARVCVLATPEPDVLQSDEIQEKYDEILSALPEDIVDKLPDGFFSDNFYDVSQAVGEAGSFRYIFDTILDLLALNIHGALSLFASICGLLFLSSVLGALRNSLTSETLSGALQLVSAVATVGALIALQNDQILLVSDFFLKLRVLVGAMLPTMTALYAMGGNVAAAVSANGAMSFFLAVCEFICENMLEATVGVCLAFSIACAFAPGINLKSLSSAIKRVFSFCIGFTMLIFNFVLGTQSLLAKSADTLSARTVKFAAGTVIPLVGGSISETLRTVGGSIEYIRTAVGTGGIIFVALLILPTIISLLLHRLCFISSAAVADLLGCETESRFLSEINGIYGYILAVVSVCSVTAVFALTLFVRCASALGT